LTPEPVLRETVGESRIHFITLSAVNMIPVNGQVLQEAVELPFTTRIRVNGQIPQVFLLTPIFYRESCQRGNFTRIPVNADWHMRPPQ
jgi:hypothetical protein